MKGKLLSDRQKTGLAMLSCGLSEAHVGERLFISKDTVHKDRKQTYKLLGASTLAQALLYALLQDELTLTALRAIRASI